MPKKPNYGFEKRRRELDKKAKKEEKKLRRLELGGEEEAPAPSDDVVTEGESGAN